MSATLNLTDEELKVLHDIVIEVENRQTDDTEYNESTRSVLKKIRGQL